jgi:predicted nucleic acid-binding protein
MSDSNTEDEQRKLVMEYLKQIIKEKLQQKNVERTKQLDILYNAALEKIKAVNTETITDDDINKLVADIQGSGNGLATN